ncbi:hypothetical protein N234_07675 [Ralstonia pickettii DTP0602]|nr:hypothetical protein N234_07675 [Ralstonia pickettii DTP0602]
MPASAACLRPLWRAPDLCRQYAAGAAVSNPGDMDNLNNSNRVNNAIKYRSQNYGGFSFGGVYSLGGVAG